MESVDLSNEETEEVQKLVGADGAEMEVDSKDPDELLFEAHPNTVFAARVEEKKLASGLYLPEGYGDDNNPTPIAKIMAVGENVANQFAETNFSIEEGDFVYVDAQFMRFAQIDGVKGIILMADGILGKVKQPE